MFQKLKTYLLGCLRTALKSLLTDDQPESDPVQPYLDVCSQTRQGTTITKYLIVGVVGSRLQGVLVAGRERGVRLVAEHEAVDSKHYQDLWKQNQGEVKLVWEDTLEEV